MIRSFICLLFAILLAAGFNLACDPKKKQEVPEEQRIMSLTELQEAFLSQKNCHNTFVREDKLQGGTTLSARMSCRVYDTMSLLELGFSTWRMTETLEHHLGLLSKYPPAERALLEALSSQSALGGIFFLSGGTKNQVHEQFNYLVAVKRNEISFVSKIHFLDLATTHFGLNEKSSEAAICHIAYSDSGDIEKIKLAFAARTLATMIRAGKVNSEADLEKFQLGDFNFAEIEKLINNFSTLTGPYVVTKKLSRLIGENFAKNSEYPIYFDKEHVQVKANCLLDSVLDDESVQKSLKEGKIKGLLIKLESSENRSETVRVAESDSSIGLGKYTHLIEFPKSQFRDINSISAQEISQQIIDASQN